jgi:hypothetical protein
VPDLAIRQGKDQVRAEDIAGRKRSTQSAPRAIPATLVTPATLRPGMRTHYVGKARPTNRRAFILRLLA